LFHRFGRAALLTPEVFIPVPHPLQHCETVMALGTGILINWHNVSSSRAVPTISTRIGQMSKRPLSAA
jgi:hypothetical protein